MLRRLVVGLCAAAAAAGLAAEPLLLIFAGAGSVPAPPWHVVGLPSQSKPFTRFSVVDLEGTRALRVEADRSYGNLVHPLRLNDGTPHLAWRWRLEQPIAAADLHTRGGDDTPVRVCVLFDLPLEKIPFFDRQVLRYARSHSADPVPGATVCYVWDAHLAAGTMLDSAFTRRIRYVVLEGGDAALHRWFAERRDVAADFTRLFGDESDRVPTITGVGVGADADNTASHSLAYVTGITLEP